jgi:hypothetical protein
MFASETEKATSKAQMVTRQNRKARFKGRDSGLDEIPYLVIGYATSYISTSIARQNLFVSTLRTYNRPF